MPKPKNPNRERICATVFPGDLQEAERIAEACGTPLSRVVVAAIRHFARLNIDKQRAAIAEASLDP